MLEALSDKLSGVFQKLGSHGAITEKDLDEAMREVRIALLEADVNFKVVRQFIASVRERALGAEVLRSLTGPQQVISIVNEELVNILGGSESHLNLSSKPTVIMLVGLKGSGKTTTAAKLALHLRKNGQKPMLVAADPYRMAAGEQLKSLGRQLNLPVYGEQGQSVAELASTAHKEAQRQGASVVIVDTAGRSTIDSDLMSEVSDMRKSLNPDEVILVVDAMTGQEAVNVAQEFHDQLNVTGIIVSKMDGDARGGAVLSIRAVSGLPVKFIGTGEKADA
jgi:signal recognition particle subunit SRP54